MAVCIYLRDGIFAEVTLFFRDGEFRPWPWTYADYREDSVQTFLLQAREYYKLRLKRKPRRGFYFKFIGKSTRFPSLS